MPLALLTAVMAGALQGAAPSSSTAWWLEGLRGGLFCGLVMLTIISCNVAHQLGYQAGREEA